MEVVKDLHAYFKDITVGVRKEGDFEPWNNVWSDGIKCLSEIVARILHLITRTSSCNRFASWGKMG